jgi:hypothetical protein
MDNQEKVVGSQKGGKSRENCRGTQRGTFQRKRRDTQRWTIQFPLDCPPFCAPTVFSGLSFLVCPYSFLWIIRLCISVQFSLDCPPLCAPTVFSGLSTFVCPYGFLWIVRPCVPLQFSLDCPPLRVDNTEKTVGAQKGGQSRESRKGTQRWKIQRKP